MQGLEFARLRLGWIALSSTLLFAPALVSADCPESCLYVGVTPPCSTDPIRSGSTSGDHGSGPGSAAYNLPVGSFFAAGYMGTRGGGGMVIARDDYRILGVEPGTLIVLAAELHIACSGSFDIGFGASLQEGTSPAQQFTFYGSNEPFYSVSERLVVPVERAAGEVFRLTVQVSAGVGWAGGGGSTSASLRFSGLPPGARVESCQGFLQDSPVPAVPLSWGSLKSRYH